MGVILTKRPPALSRRGPFCGVLRPRLLAHLEGLDHVADLRAAEAGHGQTTLEALTDLGGVVLEPPQRADRDVLRHHDALAQNSRLGVAAEETGADQTAGDETDLGRAEHLADLRRTLLDLLVL